MDMDAKEMDGACHCGKVRLRLRLSDGLTCLPASSSRKQGRVECRNVGVPSPPFVTGRR